VKAFYLANRFWFGFLAGAVWAGGIVPWLMEVL